MGAAHPDPGLEHRRAQCAAVKADLGLLGVHRLDPGQRCGGQDGDPRPAAAGPAADLAYRPVARRWAYPWKAVSQPAPSARRAAATSSEHASWSRITSAPSSVASLVSARILSWAPPVPPQFHCVTPHMFQVAIRRSSGTVRRAGTGSGAETGSSASSAAASTTSGRTEGRYGPAPPVSFRMRSFPGPYTCAGRTGESSRTARPVHAVPATRARSPRRAPGTACRSPAGRRPRGPGTA